MTTSKRKETIISSLIWWREESCLKTSSRENITRKQMPPIASNRYWSQWITVIKIMSFIEISNQRTFCWPVNKKGLQSNWLTLDWQLKWMERDKHGMDLQEPLVIFLLRFSRRILMVNQLTFGPVVSILEENQGSLVILNTYLFSRCHPVYLVGWISSILGWRPTQTVCANQGRSLWCELRQWLQKCLLCY